MKRIIFILFVLTLFPLAMAEYSCPHGEIDEPSPGKCGLYEDVNQDRLCDLSQETLKENIPPSMSKKNYHLLLISFLLIVFYLISFIASKRKIITKIINRRIWNIALLTTFLISGILGILLVIRINFGLEMNPFFNMLSWHVEAGIAMFTISMFHIIERWYYFKNLIIKK